MKIYKILFFFLFSYLFAEQKDYQAVIKDQVGKIYNKSFSVAKKQVLPISNSNNEKKYIVDKSLFIRVALEEKHLSDASWKLSSTNGFTVVADQGLPKVFKNPNLYVSYKSDAIIVNGIKFKAHDLFIKPIDGLISYKDNKFKGFFVVSRLGQIMYLVNHIDIEEYVESVMRLESIPEWPDEVNMAAAIAFRTYGLRKLLDERNSRVRLKIKLPFDIKNSSVHQNYKGHKNYPNLKKCVENTRGIILAFNNKPILAMFDVCCGGVIPAKIHSFDFSKTPYLMRDYPCHYCKTCKAYEWQVKMSFKNLESILKKEYKNIKDIKDIRITKRDPAGLVSEVRVRARHWFTLSGVKLKSLIKSLRSRCFDIEKTSGEVIFKGRGFGHHMGMCQWGALRMVKEGRSYKDVLSFYYPGTTFMKISVK